LASRFSLTPCEISSLVSNSPGTVFPWRSDIRIKLAVKVLRSRMTTKTAMIEETARLLLDNLIGSTPKTEVRENF